jgi:RNA 2',3'-cyclic 3'-phosphodiesterase
MKRIFIALKIEPGPELRNMIRGLRNASGNIRVKWVEPENIHLTLAFLGDTEEERITAAAMILNKVCSATGQFSFTIGSPGIFKSYRDLKVIWTGIRDPEALVELRRKLSEELNYAGFRLEEREFRPHITIGRVKAPGNADMLKSFISRYQDITLQVVKVKEAILFESILKPAGPVYKPVGIFKLKT